MSELFDVPEKRCKRGHVIPLNGAVVGHEKDIFGAIHPIVLKNPRLVCEECAHIDSGGETLEGMRHRPVKGKRLEKLGQESFLGSAPSIFVK